MNTALASSSLSGFAAWRRSGAALAVLLLAILLLYRETALAMATIWARSETFTHGFLVLPISLWLVWRQRGQLAAMRPQPAAAGLLLLAGAALLWLLGDLAAVNVVTQFALVAMLVAAVPSVLGWSVTRAMLFPLGFLFFAVPAGEFLMPLLMERTADFTVLALRLSGIPVYREGLNFVIPSGNWSVVEACSGVRYLIASLTVGTLFAYLSYQSNGRRWVFVGVSILVPIVANWLRAYLIVMLGHLSGNKLAAGVDHLIYGWLFFGVVIMLMFFIGARWAQPAAAPRAAALGDARGMGGARAAGVLVAALGVVLAPALVQWRLLQADAAAAPQLEAPRALAGGWQRGDSEVSRWRPAFQNPSAETTASYVRDGQAVGLYVGYYRNQNYERKLVSSENALVRPQDPIWDRVMSGLQRVPLAAGLPAMRGAEVRPQTTAVTTEDRVLVWQVYWVGGRFTASDHVAKAYSALSRLMGQGDESAVVMFFAPRATLPSAQAALEAFAVDANFVAIDAWLRQVASAP